MARFRAPARSVARIALLDLDQSAAVAAQTAQVRRGVQGDDGSRLVGVAPSADGGTSRLTDAATPPDLLRYSYYI